MTKSTPNLDVAPLTYGVASLASDFTLEYEQALSPRFDRTGAVGTHWWLCKDGVAVAYCKTVQDPRESAPLILMDIEVRLTHRGQGYCTAILASVNAVTGLRVHSTGNWTQDGAVALQRLPLAPGYVGEVHHRPTDFVQDWNKRVPRYR